MHQKHGKAQKTQKGNQAKVQNATSEQKFKMRLKNILREKSHLFAYLHFCVRKDKKTRKKRKVPTM